MQTDYRIAVPPFTRWVKILAIAHLVGYVAWLIFGRWQAAPELAKEMILVPARVFEGHLWQLVSFVFPQENPLNLVFGGLMLWMFGGELERRWGGRRFLTFYFVTIGFGAALLSLFSLGVSQLAVFPVIGLGGFLLALIVAWGLIYPDREIVFMFVIPMKGRHVMLLSLGIDALYAFATVPMAFVIHAFCAVVAALVVVFWRRYGGFFSLLRMSMQRSAARRKRSHLRSVDDDRPNLH